MKDYFPASEDTERFVLGAILADCEAYRPALTSLSIDEFSSEKHRRIFRRMKDLDARGESVDCVTVINELRQHDELNSVGGFGYIHSLDEGLPRLPHIDSHVRILQEKANLRKILRGCHHLANRATSSEASPAIAAAAQVLFASVTAQGLKLSRVADLPSVRDCGSAAIEYIREPELPRGSLVAITGDSGSGKSTLVTAWARDVAVPVLFLDRENPVSVIIDRLDRLGFKESSRLRIWGGWLPEEAPLPDSPAVIEWVKSCSPRPLVVVDPFIAFLGGDENDAAETRSFMQRCRRIADLGATVAIIHHDGKSEKARDFRGSSDFKAAIDLGFHVTNFGNGCLTRLVLRAFKTRIQVPGEIVYEYADGQFVRSEPAEAKQIMREKLTSILRLNPAVTSRRFEELSISRSIGRQHAREFLRTGVLDGSIRQETGAKNAKKHFFTGGSHAE